MFLVYRTLPCYINSTNLFERETTTVLLHRLFRHVFLLVPIYIFSFAYAQDHNIRFIRHCYNRAGSAGICDITIKGNYIFAVGHGLNIINISKPESPYQVASNTSFRFGNKIALKGNYAYVATYDHGLKIFDITDPESPALVGSCDTSEAAIAIVITGNNAFFAADSGLQVIDVSNPAVPQDVSFCPIPAHGAWDLTVAGSYAYVCANNSCLWVIDISNPISPRLISSFRVRSGYLRGVAVSGMFAYLVSNDYGLHVIDISTPDSLREIALLKYPPANYFHGISIVRNYAYMSRNGSGFYIIDISNPEAPREVGRYTSIESGAFGAAILGNHAYLADGWISILDISQAIATPDTTETLPTLPTHFSLANPYPNPFNASTLIKFELPQSSFAKVQVFDALGRLVNTLADENFNTGSHQVSWNGSKAASGQYYVQLSVPNFSETKKVVLVK